MVEAIAMRYSVYLTVNTPRGEYETNTEAYNLDEVMLDVLRHSPDCTSVVMAIVPVAESYPSQFPPFNIKAKP